MYFPYTHSIIDILFLLSFYDFILSDFLDLNPLSSSDNMEYN